MMHTDRGCCGSSWGKPKRIGANHPARRPVCSAVEHRICLECAYSVGDLERCPECGQEVNAAIRAVWEARRELLRLRSARLKRTAGLLFLAVIVCGLGVLGLVLAPRVGLASQSFKPGTVMQEGVPLAVMLTMIAVVAAWCAPWVLTRMARSHDRAPLMAAWESTMWRIHVPWMSIAPATLVLAITISLLPSDLAQMAGYWTCVLLLIGWGTACIWTFINWTDHLRRALQSVCLLSTRTGTWLIVLGVPMFLASAALGFLGGIFGTLACFANWAPAPF